VEWISGNVFIRPMGGLEGLRPGDVVRGHTHNFDHTTIFFGGRWRARKWCRAVPESGDPVLLPDGNEAWLLAVDMERDGPFHLLIEAGARHEFTFLGSPVPAWMESYISALSPEEARAFQAQHTLAVGRAWCVYSHRTPQGDIALHDTGWHEAYR
jgi:hypothetical protein